MIAAAVMMGASMMSVTPDPAAALADTVEALVFSDCIALVRGDISVSSRSDMSARGYAVQPADEEGDWAARSLGAVMVRIGTAAGKPGCRLRVSGSSAAPIYEALLQRLLARGYAFTGGHRSPTEPQFVLDTVVSQSEDAGVISMFRMNLPQATAFALTLYPSSPQSRH